MTRTELQELHELSKTPEELQAQLASALASTDVSIHRVTAVGTAKKRRSDAGIPRKRPPVPTAVPAGSITDAQADKLRELAEAVWLKQESHQIILTNVGDSAWELRRAKDELDEFIAALTAK